jgi:hypothetical protein
MKENMEALAMQFVTLGFPSEIGTQLALYSSLQLPSFHIRLTVNKEADKMRFDFFFEKSGDDYVPQYFDVWLQKAINLPDKLVGGVSVTDLDNRMKAVDWQNLLAEKSTVLSSGAIQDVLRQIALLKMTGEADLVEALQVKHWWDTPLEELMGLNAFQSRFEISQRFYFFDGHTGIGVEQAYLFLCNRWMQKQMLQKKRQLVSGKENFAEESVRAKRKRQRSNSLKSGEKKTSE